MNCSKIKQCCAPICYWQTSSHHQRSTKRHSRHRQSTKRHQCSNVTGIQKPARLYCTQWL